MIVLDASAAVELLLARELSDPIRVRIAQRGETLHAPHVIDVEVGHAVRRLHRLGHVATPRGDQVMEDLRAMRLVRYPHGPLLARAWSLRDNLSFYDATYVALAEALESPLLTLDARIASAPGHDAAVEVIAELS